MQDHSRDNVRSRRRGVWARIPALILTVVIAVALIVRTTVGDIGYASSAIYYALPWTVIAAVAAAAAALWALGARPRMAAAHVGVFALAGALALSTTFFANPCVSTDDATRLFFWNIGRGRGTWARIAEEVAAHDADIVALVEAGKPDAKLQRFWTERFPHYRIRFAGGGMILMTRVPDTDGALEALAGISSLYGTRLPDLGVRLYLVDLDASPRFSKLEMIRAIFARADAGEGPAIVLGDFNAPSDARGFSEIRDRYHQAFESAGAGNTGTWPRRTPLVAIDHIWLSRDIGAQCTRLIDSEASDHRAIVADILLPG